MNGQEQRRVIAVVTDAFAPFHREVLDGLRPHFSKSGFGTLAVAGRDVRTDRLIEATTKCRAEYNGAFGTQLDVRGAVVVCGATPPEMSDAAIAEYVANLTEGPVVSFGIALPGVPSLTIAWDDAIAALMSHMVSDPRRQRFVFVRGYAGDPHSTRREHGFRSGLAAAGLPVDERLIVNGNYSVADALIAVAQLLEKGQEFDGLIAANDDMATGAIAALTGHGLRIPEDVIVAGFDDSVASFTSVPPLTTVQLNTDRLTAATAALLIDSIASGIAPPPDLEIQIESGLVIRESSRPVVIEREAETRPQRDDLAQHLLERINSRWEAHRAPKRLDLDALTKAAVATMLTGDDSFSRARHASYAEVEWFADPADVHWLRHAASELRALTAEVRIPEAGLRAMSEQLAAIDRRLLPTEMQNEVELQAHRQLQERLVMRLASCSNTDSLWEALRTGLRSLGMVNAWVAAIEPDESLPPTSDHQGAAGVNGPETGQLGLSHQEATMRLLFSLQEDSPAIAERFSRTDVLPPRLKGILEHDAHVLVPLRAGVSDIGYMVVEPSGQYLLELEAIASGIAQVLRHVHQVGDLEHQAARLRLANEALDRLARHDSLTGLANRSLLLERLEQEIDTIGPDEEISILFVDLDGFKLINDTLGHEAGDHLLRLIANRLGEVVGDGDTVARLGGDEFTVILRHRRGSTRALDIASAVLESAAKPCFLLGQTIRVSASLGIAQFPVDGTTTDELMRNADAAMYAAKASGKNRYAHYAEGLAVENELELELREALRVGLDNDEFDLEYQPRVCIRTGEVLAYEALLRWNPSRNIADADRRPDRFILVAERNGLITALDSFSLDRACRQAKQWADAGQPVPVSVNVSVKRLQEADIVTQVVDVLERHNLPPELLELEISEQALLSDIEASISKLTSVRELGVRCSIDDYGTGVSSVADLVRLPVDMLKIDASLIAGVGIPGDSNRSMVRGIVALCAGLGLATIAEGIETEAQLRFLLDAGCTEGQGFMFTKCMETDPVLVGRSNSLADDSDDLLRLSR